MIQFAVHRERNVRVRVTLGEDAGPGRAVWVATTDMSLSYDELQ